jgi:hypothetical protein
MSQTTTLLRFGKQGIDEVEVLGYSPGCPMLSAKGIHSVRLFLGLLVGWLACMTEVVASEELPHTVVFSADRTWVRRL